MEKILLAIDGMLPDKGVVEYALELCRRIRAELDILHLVNPEPCGKPSKELSQQAGSVTGYFQQAMMAAAFAESGEHETAKAVMDAASAHFNGLLPDADRKKVRYRVQLNSGHADQAIRDYVDQNKNIVLAIYETGDCAHACEMDENGQHHTKPQPTGKISKKPVPTLWQLQKKLSVPLVVRCHSGS